jgi:hypothetical protein
VVKNFKQNDVVTGQEVPELRKGTIFIYIGTDSQKTESFDGMAYFKEADDVWCTHSKEPLNYECFGKVAFFRILYVPPVKHTVGDKVTIDEFRECPYNSIAVFMNVPFVRGSDDRIIYVESGVQRMVEGAYKGATGEIIWLPK